MEAERKSKQFPGNTNMFHGHPFLEKTTYKIGNKVCVCEGSLDNLVY